MGRGVRRAGQPRLRMSDRVLRRAHRLPRGDRGDLAELHAPSLCGAPDPGGDAVRELQGPQTVAAALKPIYQAADADAARIKLEAFQASELGRKNPHTVATFDNAWERFTPFLAFPPMLRRVIYTTNSIESLNYQLRKIIKNRGHFPNDDAVIKLLWLAICTIEDKRARDRAKEAGLGRGAKRKAEGASSKAKSPPTGSKPSPNSPSSTPTESTPTYDQTSCLTQKT